MKDDVISRQQAILQLSHNKCGNDENDIAVQHDIETIRALPSAQPERKKGHWQVRQRHAHYPDGRPHTDLYCPFCGRTDHNGDGDYCGYCGANLMEGEQNGPDNKTD